MSARRKNSELREILLAAESEFLLSCKPATFLQRLAANLLDLIFLTLLCGGVKKLLILVFSVLEISKPWLSMYLFISFSTLVYLIFFLIPLCELGGTPGKILLGLKVIDEKTGGFLQLHQAITREFLIKICLGIGTCGGIFIVPVFRDQDKTLQDLVVKSVVKKTH